MELGKEYFGPLWKYIANEEITDVDYNGREIWLTNIYNERYRVNQAYVDENMTLAFVEQFTQRIANVVSQQFNKQNPELEAETSELRVTVLHESIARSGRSISIRKTPPVIRLTAEKALQEQYCRQQQYMSYSYEDVIWKEASDPACIRLDFVGDICLDENWCTGKTAKNHMADYFSDEVKKELISADFTMANNEFAYTTRGQRQVGKAYCFRADPKDAGFLRTLGIDMVSVANNQVIDYGEKGLLDTLDTINPARIPYRGGGRNLTEASAVLYVVTGGRKIAIVSATEIERFYHFTQKAQKEKPGVLKTQQEEVWKKELKRAKKNSDYVIAYVHWGTEGKIHYGQDQTEIADLSVKAGADAVIGGHPHRLQGVEFIKNVPVAYSVGNFWFSTGKLYTTIAQIQIDGSGSLKLRMIPCIQDSLTTSILTEKKQIKAFYHYLADISNHVGIDEDGFFYLYKNVEKPGVSPYAYTSGRRYGQYFDDVDLDLKSIDIVGNLQ